MITTGMIKELREKTGAGIMMCKKVLSETNGDMDQALEILREMEAALAAKKAERVTAEGLVGIYVADDKKTGAMVEILCETDFVASNKEFVALAENMAKHVSLSPAQDVDSLLQERYTEGTGPSVKDTIASFVSKFGENITVSRFTKFSTEAGTIHSYVHNGGKIGVLVELTSEKTDPLLEETSKELAMHIAAMNPAFLSRDSADQSVIEQEEHAFRELALSEGKPPQVVEKIVAGKVNKFFKKNCLLEQPWIKNEDMTIAEMLEESSKKLGANITVVRFSRFERGKA